MLCEFRVILSYTGPAISSCKMVVNDGFKLLCLANKAFISQKLHNRTKIVEMQLKYCYIAIFAAVIQYNMADLGYRYIAHCNILLYIVMYC